MSQSRLIEAGKLESEMYHNAFEIDTDLQKWDSGCWIRYKMFENVIEEQPTVKAISVYWIEDWMDSYLERGADDAIRNAFEEMIEDWERENE